MDGTTYLYSFCVVDQRSKDDDSKDQEEDEKHQFFGRSSERLNENLQTWRVSGELEQSQDSNDGEKLQHVGFFQMGSHLLKYQVDVKAQGSDVVNYVNAAKENTKWTNIETVSSRLLLSTRQHRKCPFSTTTEENLSLWVINGNWLSKREVFSNGFCNFPQFHTSWSSPYRPSALKCSALSWVGSNLKKRPLKCKEYFHEWLSRFSCFKGRVIKIICQKNWEMCLEIQNLSRWFINFLEW